MSATPASDERARSLVVLVWRPSPTSRRVRTYTTPPLHRPLAMSRPPGVPLITQLDELTDTPSALPIDLARSLLGWSV